MLKYLLRGDQAACGAKSTHVRAQVREPLVRVLISTVVGGGEAQWMQNVALSGQRVGF